MPKAEPNSGPGLMGGRPTKEGWRCGLGAEGDSKTDIVVVLTTGSSSTQTVKSRAAEMEASERAGGEGDWMRQLPLDGITRDWARLGSTGLLRTRQERTGRTGHGRRRTGKEIATYNQQPAAGVTVCGQLVGCLEEREYIACLPACLSPTKRLAEPGAGGESEGFARWGQLK